MDCHAHDMYRGRNRMSSTHTTTDQVQEYDSTNRNKQNRDTRFLTWKTLKREKPQDPQGTKDSTMTECTSDYSLSRPQV